MESLVDTAWLARELDAGDLRVIDASWHLPAAGRDAAAEYRQGHIPGARFLDLATFTDSSSPVPSALPDAQGFAERMGTLGIRPGDRVVLYDDSDVKTSARAWFILRRGGIRDVAILDGGLAKWKAEGRPLETGEQAGDPCDFPCPSCEDGQVRFKHQILANCSSGEEQVVDARDAVRFTGDHEDTVHGLPGGHIPGSRHLWFRDLYRADGTFRPLDEIEQAFREAGLDLDRPIVASCGSGVTAAVLLFALHLMGRGGALYDGSWSEWGADPDTPKEKGPAAA